MNIKNLATVLATMTGVFIGFNANASCKITSVRHTEVAQTFEKYGGWDSNRGLTAAKFNEVCAKLAKANASIQINATSVVLGNQSIGWASISVKDLNTAIATMDYASYNTQVNSFASQNKADEIMVDAINQALQNWVKVDLALDALEKERNQVKAIYGKKK